MVTVSQRPNRVVVEDVWSRRRAVAADVEAVGTEIARLLATSPDAGPGKANPTEADR